MTEHSSSHGGRARRFRPARSLRWRIVVWITLVVTAALASVIVMTRSVMLSQVNASANAAVEQEIDEFHLFAANGIDPETQEPFASAERLIETYLARQYPADDELLVGLADGTLIQFDYSQLSGRYPPVVQPQSPLATELFGAEESAGIIRDPQLGAIHWGRVTIDGPEPAYLVVAYFTADDRAAVREQIRLISLIGLGGLLASVLIAYLIAGQILAPLRRLRRVAGEITNKDLTRRVPVAGDDELAHLARTFNEMLDRIETAYTDQRTFVDDAGHELRTPITVVRGQLELLEMTSDPAERTRSIALATAELDRMSRMVNDMLTLAVADTGDFVTPAEVDIAELMIDIEDKASMLSERTRLVDVAEGRVLLDEHRVTEAILELCSNALRYSDEHVDLGANYTGGGAERQLRIWVRDRGPGVNEDDAALLFDRFSRGTPAADVRPGGAGLGLSIVHAIGQAHGGRAFVDSTVGLGSVFGLELPAPEPGDGDGVTGGTGGGSSGTGGQAAADINRKNRLP